MLAAPSSHLAGLHEPDLEAWMYGGDGVVMRIMRSCHVVDLILLMVGPTMIGTN